MLVAGLAGVVFGLLGVWMPGSDGLHLGQPGSGRNFVLKARKTSELFDGRLQNIQKALLPVEARGEHRIFVSPILVYLPKDPEPVQPLDPKMKTSDGIEIGWKMKYGFNPTNPKVKDEDPDQDGFSNLEEFLAGTDPTAQADSPAKESKLKISSAEPVIMNVSFTEKSPPFFTIRFQVGGKRREFKGREKDSFWIKAGPEGVDIFTDKNKMEEARLKAQQEGKASHVIPMQFVSYHEKVEKIKDAKAGGVEVEVDNSWVVLKRSDGIPEQKSLALSTPLRLQNWICDVGEVRFRTPASGGLVLGPFQLGQAFSYEGKEFLLMGREGEKIQLINQSDGGKDPFWVFP